MDDVYGDRISAFGTHLRRHIESQGWCKVHFHYIGEGLSSSEESFRAALDIAKEHESELWIAGMASIHKYQIERDRTELAIASKGPLRAVLTLTCGTDPELYDQYLTIQLTLPSSWSPEEVTVKSVGSGVVVPTSAAPSCRTIRFDARPITAAYIVERSR